MPDTLKTSVCANRLFPTARLSGMGVADTSLCTPDSRMNSVLRVLNREMTPEYVILTQNSRGITLGHVACGLDMG